VDDFPLAEEDPGDDARNAADDRRSNRPNAQPGRGIVATEPKLGPTGEFPQGHLNQSDEGGLTFSISRENGKIVIDFGKPTIWIGLDKETALKLAVSLLKFSGAVKIEIDAGQGWKSAID
jgi:hypothetical protein